jgi:putative heme-binding domain-containing protein
VPSKGKCSLIVDQNGDDVADQEITISTGWKEIPQAVDALGMAVGADGSLYFGLGTTDFSNGFLVDADGKGHYDITSERGTILKLSPDFQTRQIIATGIRFPVALAFNAHGDLFCTDQEGATWLPNGNPFDELLHIRSGRHYGFPPRHSRHLPNVIDEPSTFDYRPQHQSTCGLVFNIPANPGASTFGPDWWRDNAFVAGYSRGRIYRTELVKTRGEYVGRTSEFALFSMLVSEVCLAPDGSLVVAAHSGLPDWGTGPTGKGKLYKIRYTGRELAQPVMAWANGPREVRVAFDRELRIEDLPKLKEGLRIEFGSAVAAGDRFETLRPGYAVVAAQTAEPRHWLETRSFGVTPDRRTLVIGTDLQTRAQPHAITLGRPSVNGSTEHGTLSLPQHNTMDLGYGLAGAKVRWESHDGAESWEGWLPHLDLAIARRFTRGSSEHDRLWGLLTHPGVLVLQARLELASLLRPAVQPGSKVDDVLPPETAILSFRSARLSDVRASAGTLRMKSGDKGGEATLSVTDSKDGSPVDLLIQLDTGVGTPRAGDDSVGMDVDYRTNEDDRPRALPPHRILLPWSMENDAGTAVSVRSIPAELAGGNWARGREVFQSELALCSRCHAIRGQGGKIGPDLSNLVERDHASVLRDIREPSAALNPDYITHTVALEDGRVLTGTIRTEGDTLFVGDEKGEETAVPRTQVTELKPGAISTGIVEKLGSDRLKDLLTYLLTSEPTPDSGR